jgi:hypothetical protein
MSELPGGSRWPVLLILASLAACGGQTPPPSSGASARPGAQQAERTCKIPWHRDDESIDAYETRVRDTCRAGYTVVASDPGRSGNIRTVQALVSPPEPPKPTSMDVAAVEFGRSFFDGKLFTCGARTFAYIYHYGDPKLTEISAPRFLAHSDAAKLTEMNIKNGVDYDGDVQLELDASRVWEGRKWSAWENDTLQVGLENSIFHLQVQHKRGKWSGHAPLAGLLGPKKPNCRTVPAP